MIFAFSQNLDLTILKNVNGTDEPWFDVMEPLISKDYFAIIIGISPVFIEPVQTLYAAGLTGAEVELFKEIFKRPRPYESYPWVIKRATASGYSMPSGHAAMSFEAAYIWSERFPSLWPIFYSIAAYISLSRIYYGVHYPSDVLIGALIGYLNASIISKSVKSDPITFNLSYNF